MCWNVFGMYRILFWLWIFPGLLLNGGCFLQRPSLSKKESPAPLINKVVVVGFRVAVPQGKEPDVVRNPFSGASLLAKPVPHYVVQKMTAVLFDQLVADKRYELVSPGQAKGAYSTIIDSDPNLAMTPLTILQEVGETFEADAVLAGYIYRWREREGTDYAVDRPASVAFDLQLVRPTDGAILWKVKFDKTQRSLSENILDLATFLEGRGRWMTVEKLAVLGLQKALWKMPSGPGKSKD